MSPSNKDLANLIVDFLSHTVENKEVSEDYVDSLNVAIDCITEAFEFDRESVATTLEKTFAGRSLKQVVEAASVGSSSPQESVKVNIPCLLYTSRCV